MANTKYSYNEKRKAWIAFAWDGTYKPDGSKHRKMLTSKKSSRDLERIVAEFNRSVAEGEPTGFSTVTFREYAFQWLETNKASREKNTQKMYRTTINAMSNLFDIRVCDLCNSHFQQTINLNIAHPKTCKNIYGTFSQIIRAAVRDRILPRIAPDDILTGITLPKYHKPEKRALTDTERRAVKLVGLDGMKLAFLLILYYCGLRRGEALALMPDDFDWAKKTVSITKTLIFVGNAPEIKPCPKSDNGRRTVPLPDDLIARIREYVDSCTGTLFHTRNGGLMTETGYRRMWESIVTNLNVAVGWNPNAKADRKPKPIDDLTAHIFRHNYCTELCYKIPEISTKMIARLMGDNERMVLDVYSHIVEEKEKVAETVASALVL